MSHPGEEKWPNLSAAQQTGQQKPDATPADGYAHLKAKAVTRRRIEITLERERSLVVGRRKTSIKGWCEGCGPSVRTVTPDETNRYDRADDQRLVEFGRFHFGEGSAASLLVCVESLKELSQALAHALFSGGEKRRRLA